MELESIYSKLEKFPNLRRAIIRAHPHRGEIPQSVVH
ncbi:hypothetical protein LS215_3026 [Sulfolobus islandicus L.S.2.15]|uniref:Uncharacterized protein n=1 Tax=Saccharolobus islandicus (strain L.S.2.15 / Lassen \|nr:hypothetical protein LS215_3026 [Sulfolobus islandicus L.S.2.15]